MQAFKGVKISDNNLPLRPGYGANGKQIALRTNFFPVTIPKGPFYEYHINIAPSISSKHMKRRIIQLAEDTLLWQSNLEGYVVHDHSSKLVACQRLSETLTITVPLYPEENKRPPAPGSPPVPEYALTFDFVRDLETDSLAR